LEHPRNRQQTGGRNGLTVGSMVARKDTHPCSHEALFRFQVVSAVLIE